MSTTVFGRLALAERSALAGPLAGAGSARRLLVELADLPAATADPLAEALLQGGLLEAVDGREPAPPRSWKFGELAIAHHGLKRPDLEAALASQQAHARRGRYLWIGEILHEAYGLRPAVVQAILRFQKDHPRGQPVALTPLQALGPLPSVPLPPATDVGRTPDPDVLAAELLDPSELRFYQAILRRVGAPGTAFYDLGRCFGEGIGVAADVPRAERCFQLAAALGPAGLAASFRASLALGLALLAVPARAAEAGAWLLYGCAAHARFDATRLPEAGGDAYQRGLRRAAEAWPAWLSDDAKALLAEAALQGHAGARALLATDLGALQRAAPAGSLGQTLRLTWLAELATELLDTSAPRGLAPALGGPAASGDAPALGGRKAAGPGGTPALDG